MSLLAELLSKAKGTLKGNKDIPPALKELISPKREKKTTSGLFLFIGLLIICSITAGSWFVYFVHEKTGKAPGPDVSALHQPSRTAAREQEEDQPVPLVKTADRENTPAPVPEKAPGPQTGEETENSGAEGPPMNSQAGGTEPAEHPEDTARKEAGQAPLISREKAARAVPPAEDLREVKETRGEAAASNPAGGNDTEAAASIYSALQFEEQRKYPEALAEYMNALKYNPNSPLILSNISSLFLQMGVYESALQYARKALAINGAYVPAMVNSGVSLAGLNKNEAAERLLKSAVDSEPYNRNALYNLGLLYEKQGKFKEALRLYQNLVNTGDTDAYIHMARVLELSGRREEAMGVYSGIIRSALISESVKKEAEQSLGRLK